MIYLCMEAKQQKILRVLHKQNNKKKKQPEMNEKNVYIQITDNR